MKIQEPEIQKIEALTGGKIQDYKFEDEWGDNKEHYLRKSFTSKDGKYIGNYDKALWYIKNNLKVCNDHPNGVAELYKNNEHIGYYGYTHRGGNTFKIGDKLFDEKYKPIKEDYTSEEWNEWETQYNKAISDPNEDEWWINDIKRDGISRYIPYSKRGKKIIENLEEAKQAAINISNYLS